MTIIIAFHTSHHRDFKNYYTGFVAQFWKDRFPLLLSYTRVLHMNIVSGLSCKKAI